ncbi:hypothetical protein [Ruminococcus sp.]|uniref:hypothetical protein n=1 Tax=Ruminococcus sp. TaxID=41978 RepID=UPI0038906A79
MDYYTRSSLAYNFTLFEEEDDSSRVRARAKKTTDDADGSTTQEQETRASRKEKKEADLKRRRTRRSKIIRISLGVLFGFAIAFIVASIIHGQVQLTELNQEIANAKAQLAEQQSIYTQLEMKVDSSISTTVVEDYARNNLKMNKAANSQKEFVDLSEGDKAEVSLSADKNIFESIAEAFTSLWS